MVFSRSVSGAFCIGLVLVALSPYVAWGQDRFGTREMANRTDYGEYNQYRDYMEEERPSNRISSEERRSYRPEMIRDEEDDARQDVRKQPPDLRGSPAQAMSLPPPTRLEIFYRDRTGDQTLEQFGYDLFLAGADKNRITDRRQDDDMDAARSVTVLPPMGVVQDDYRLQVGDIIGIRFTGERKSAIKAEIRPDGRFFVDGLPTMMAAGRSLGDLRREIIEHLREMHYRGDVLVTVEGIRQIGVLVAGHVQNPGRHNLNAFHSVIDALQQAGGIRKTGSLRQVRLIRGGQTTEIDLYDFLMNGFLPQNIQLADGDRIIVPPVGATIAVIGDVKQPGIYELGTDSQGVGSSRRVALGTALHMAGGVLGAGDNRFTLRNANSKIINLNNIKQNVIDDGSILTVTRAQDRVANAVELLGYSRKNGLYDVDETPTLRALLSAPNVFADDVYPLMGVIARAHRGSLTRSLMGFSPQGIVAGTDDRQLEAGDKVYLFSHTDIQNMMSNDINNKNKNNNLLKFSNSISQYVQDKTVAIQGAVREAGYWPVGVVASVKSVIAVAGGLSNKADMAHIEIVSDDLTIDGHKRRIIDANATDLNNVMVMAGDQIRVGETFAKALTESVTITGEVKNPGTYDLMRGDTLSTLLARAGGLTAQAYPPGAVFSRKSERKREEQKFRAAAQQLEHTVSVNLNATDKDATLTPAQISMARDLANDLRSVRAVGRITVEADPAVLETRPELDMLLEGGDSLHIPKRNLTVRVSGEVMNAASLLFEDNKDAEDYIREAGGMTYYADTGRVFVLYPDGSSHPLRSSAWQNDGPAMVIPGSTIIVPRDPKPFNFMDSFKDITQILTNMAITTVFIDDVVSD